MGPRGAARTRFATLGTHGIGKGAVTFDGGRVGRVLRVGGLRIRVDQRDQRCVMVTIDPVTLRRNPAILRVIAKVRGARLGVCDTTVEPGRVAVGDPVELEPCPAWPWARRPAR